MSEVKRLEMDHKGLPFVDENGVYVLYEDYAALKEKFDFKQNLTEQVVALQKQCDALAAENVALKNFAWSEVVAADQEKEDRWMMECTGARDRFISMQTPTTDAYLNSVRAEVIPEGYVIVPQQMHLSADAMESLCFHCGDGGFAFGDFKDGLLWVGNIENDDGTKTYGLNIATAEYPEEGSANVSEFAAQLRAGKDGE